MDHAVIIGGLAIIVTLLGASIRTAKSHIEQRVEKECDDRLDRILDDVGAIRLNVLEVSTAVGKVAELERRLSNGLETRLINVETNVAEMHGWIKAQNGNAKHVSEG